MSNHYPLGSTWRKWDLHVHVPGDRLNDGYKAGAGTDPVDLFCEVLESSDVAVFGLTHYFDFKPVQRVLDRFSGLYPESEKRFFFNLELRLNETVNKQLQEVNLHLIFNPSVRDRIEEFLARLKTTRTDQNGRQLTCADLKSKGDFEAATVNRKDLKDAVKDTFGEKFPVQDYFVTLVPANNDGIRPEGGKQRKAVISDEIEKLADGFFGGLQNTEYFLKPDRYGTDDISPAKPVFAGSDAHSFDDLDNMLGKRLLGKNTAGDSQQQIPEKDITWIKADPTYEGLKQVLYEPMPGERVWIGPDRPDYKEPYMVIRNIRFSDSDEFPEQIDFNENLCSIVGSRSSGKSSLLAYVADAVDSDQTRSLLKNGPGWGYKWSDIDFQYAVEWSSGQSSNDVEGRILFVRQNLLFEQSQDPEAIKERIEPILVNTLEEFGRTYQNTVSKIDDLNREIGERVDDWFELANGIDEISEKHRALGDKTAIKAQAVETQTAIDTLGSKSKLNEKETAKYQELQGTLTSLEKRVKELEEELVQLAATSESNPFFKSLTISFKPILATLPSELVESISKILEPRKAAVLEEINNHVIAYKKAITIELSDIPKTSGKIKEKNKALLTKYERNEELTKLVTKLAKYKATQDQILRLERNRTEKTKKQTSIEQSIGKLLTERKDSIETLPRLIKDEDQSGLEGIVFDIESGISEDDRERMQAGVNVRDSSQFVSNYGLNLMSVRKNPAKFLTAIHTGQQKLVRGNQKNDVAREVLMTTETILLVGQMEGDRIGGFQDSTMTPGKRALFALRLILLESDDKWPLLIDQPEDDLDSRSIYDEIVPFLKAKKKERQIIMVSHNANLVIGSDSEQLIVTNRHGSDRPNSDGRQFNYLTGSLEYTRVRNDTSKDTLRAQGTCEHACAILDGGRTAFEDRKKKYQIR